MKLSAKSAIGGAVAFAAFLGVAGLRPAQAADNVRVRGTIASLEGSTLTVKTREGPTSALGSQARNQAVERELFEVQR